MWIIVNFLLSYILKQKGSIQLIFFLSASLNKLHTTPILPCRLAEPFRGQVPSAEPGQRTVRPYRCSPRSKDTNLEHKAHLHLWNPSAGYHWKTNVPLQFVFKSNPPICKDLNKRREEGKNNITMPQQWCLPCDRLSFWIASQQSETLGFEDFEAVAGRSQS